MRYGCCFHLFVFYILKSEKVMNMHKAKHYTQVTCLTCVTAAHNCTRQISLSLTNKGMREKRRVISWEHFSFPLCRWKTNTLMMQTHMHRSPKLWYLKHKKTQIYPQPFTDETQSTSQSCMLTLLLFKVHFRGMLRMSTLLSNSFKVCC